VVKETAVKQYHVEFVYADPYDGPDESFEWTMEQLADTIRIDQLEWNPEYRVFGHETKPLLVSEYQDVQRDVHRDVRW
jgi:hypothetical protein